MTDLELDRLLDQWKTPAAPPTLERSVLEGFRARNRRARPRIRTWFALAGAVAAVTLAIRAFPQMLTTPPPPYTVDTEYIIYDSAAAGTVRMLASSYSRNGSETFLSRTLPGDPMGTLRARVEDSLYDFRSLIAMKLTFFFGGPESPQTPLLINLCSDDLCTQHEGGWLVANRAEMLKSGCRNEFAVGQETVLDYSASKLRVVTPGGVRLTGWLAPTLGCFPLRVLVERRQADGSFRLYQRREAIRISLNQPEHH